MWYSFLGSIFDHSQLKDQKLNIHGWWYRKPWVTHYIEQLSNTALGPCGTIFLMGYTLALDSSFIFMLKQFQCNVTICFSYNAVIIIHCHYQTIIKTTNPTQVCKKEWEVRIIVRLSKNQVQFNWTRHYSLLSASQTAEPVLKMPHPQWSKLV